MQIIKWNLYASHNCLWLRGQKNKDAFQHVGVDVKGFVFNQPMQSTVTLFLQYIHDTTDIIFNIFEKGVV